MRYVPFMKKRCEILQPNTDTVEQLLKVIKCSPIFASILVNRGMASPEDISDFLNPSLNLLRPPFCIKDINIAVQRIYKAIKDNEKLLIFGDYDVDGVTATTILYQFFCYVGIDVSYYVPHRLTEGYDLQVTHIREHALANRIKLIITVDCGSNSHEAVQAANKVGIDVIITDHHKISRPSPPALAIINPNQPDCPAGFEHLAGVGVALYLLVSLRKHLRDRHFWHNRPEPNLKEFIDLVALGTMADLVPLTFENRIFCAIGKEVIQDSKRPGIQALVEASGLKLKVITAEDLVFRLSPRLNAAGRMGHAKEAIELLTTIHPDTAKQKAGILNQMNVNRQHIEIKIIDEICQHINNNPHVLQKGALVFTSSKWHLGVLGIVASRLVERYHRPVVLISTKGKEGKGSARSIPGFNLYKGLQACSKDLESFGGHPAAAGLKIKYEKIKPFEQHFEKTVQKMTGPNDFLPIITIDYVLDFDHISDSLIDELESLKPHGPGNPAPIFMAKNVDVLSSKIVGGNHRQMQLRQTSGRTGKTFRAIHFNAKTDPPLKNSFEQIIFRLDWNRWNGKKTKQIMIEDTETFTI